MATTIVTVELEFDNELGDSEAFVKTLEEFTTNDPKATALLRKYFLGVHDIVDEREGESDDDE